MQSQRINMHACCLNLCSAKWIHKIIMEEQWTLANCVKRNESLKYMLLSYTLRDYKFIQLFAYYFILKRHRRDFGMYWTFQYNYNRGCKSWTSMKLLVSDLWIENICVHIFPEDSPYTLTLLRFYSIMCNYPSAKIISQEEFRCRGIMP